MTRPRIALLNAAHDGDHTRRNFRRELAADLVEFHLPGGDRPETLAFDAAVVTGSKASAYWDEGWIEEAKAWARRAVRDDMPLLGICFGHQFLADVLGGSVEPMDKYEIGYRKVRQTGESRLFDGVDERFTVFTTHSDRVTELPPDAELLAENDYGIHGFRKDRVFGIQAHPEYDRATAVSVTEDKEDVLAPDTLERALSGITDENVAAAATTKTVFDNFTAFVSGFDGDQGRPVEAASDD